MKENNVYFEFFWKFKISQSFEWLTNLNAKRCQKKRKYVSYQLLFFKNIVLYNRFFSKILCCTWMVGCQKFVQYIRMEGGRFMFLRVIVWSCRSTYVPRFSFGSFLMIETNFCYAHHWANSIKINSQRRQLGNKIEWYVFYCPRFIKIQNVHKNRLEIHIRRCKWVKYQYNSFLFYSYCIGYFLK